MKIALAILGFSLVLVLILGGCAISYHNQAVGLEVAAAAIQENNKNEHSLMQAKIAQSAQVTKAQADTIARIVVEYAAARGSDGGSVVKAVSEAIPEIPPAVWTNLQNVIVSSRDRFAGNQAKLLDLKREHDALRQRFPSSIVVGGRRALDVVIVTSSATQEAFLSGTDDQLQLDL